jgi:hypothetical protein
MRGNQIHTCRFHEDQFARGVYHPPAIHITLYDISQCLKTKNIKSEERKREKKMGPLESTKQCGAPSSWNLRCPPAAASSSSCLAFFIRLLGTRSLSFLDALPSFLLIPDSHAKAKAFMAQQFPSLSFPLPLRTTVVFKRNRKAPSQKLHLSPSSIHSKNCLGFYLFFSVYLSSRYSWILDSIKFTTTENQINK